MSIFSSTFRNKFYTLFGNTIRARTVDGLKLYDDGGNLGLQVMDGGGVNIGALGGGTPGTGAFTTLDVTEAYSAVDIGVPSFAAAQFRIAVAAGVDRHALFSAESLNAGESAAVGLHGKNNQTGEYYLGVYGSGVVATQFGTALANYFSIDPFGASLLGMMIGPRTNVPIIFGSNALEQMRIKSTGIAFSNYIESKTTAGITASTTQTQGNGALTSDINEVSVCANVNDTVTLPAAVAGRTVTVINNGAQTLKIFPASGDNLGAGVDTATTLAAGSNVTFAAYDATKGSMEK